MLFLLHSPATLLLTIRYIAIRGNTTRLVQLRFRRDALLDQSSAIGEDGGVALVLEQGFEPVEVGLGEEGLAQVAVEPDHLGGQ